jgi:hypothetical protein
MSRPFCVPYLRFLIPRKWCLYKMPKIFQKTPCPNVATLFVKINKNDPLFLCKTEKHIFFQKTLAIGVGKWYNCIRKSICDRFSVPHLKGADTPL